MNDVRRASGTLVLTVCVCLAGGCSDRRVRVRADESGPPVRGGTLELVGSSDVDHLSTTSAYVSSTIWLLQTLARQLVAYTPAPDSAARMRPSADLAVEVPSSENGGISADGLSYVFHLRRGVLWDSHPPREVTAHDVVRAFKLFCNPVNPVGAPTYYTGTIAGMADYCEQFAHVPGSVAGIREFVTAHELEGVRAIDDFTVAFRLRTRASDFLNLVAMPFASPVPVEYLDTLPDSPEFRQHTISNGPYRIARYVQNREIILERNPVFDPRTDPLRPAYVDGMRVRLGADAELVELQIEAGTADLSFGESIPLASVASLLATADPTAWLSPGGGMYGVMRYLVFNHVGPNNRGALKQRRVRMAIAMAIDKAAIAQLAGGAALGRPLNQAVPSSGAGFRPGGDQLQTPRDHGDPELSARLLAEAGYPHGLQLTLAYPIFSSLPIAAQSLQASLKRAGIVLRLVPFTQGDYWGRVMPNPENARRGQWDLGLSAWTPDWFGPNNGRSVISPLFDGRQVGQNSQNFGNYQGAEVDAAIDRATTAAGEEAAEQAWVDAARHLMDDVAFVPLTEERSPYARSRRVRHCLWAPLGLSCDLSSVWLADGRPASGGSR
jgi:ABC-type transport system substrate-binding protein